MLHVTAVVICHKLEQYVDRAVGSLVTQARKPDRIVLLGTDCRDETRRALDAWTHHLHGVEAVYSDRPLTCAQSKSLAARVALAKKATNLPLQAEQAFFTLDADDWVLPHFMHRTARYMEASDAAVVGCDYQVLSDDGYMTESGVNHGPMSEVFARNPLPCCSLIRLDAFQAVGGFCEDLIFEDWGLWVALAKAGYRLFRYPQVLFTHVRHQTNLTKGCNVQRAIEQIEWLTKSKSTAMPSPHG